MNTYLKRASLQGYRTIKNVDVDFAPGLNIIIGKNGSGKTNFMSFLHSCLTFSYSGLPVFESKLEFSGESNYCIRAGRDLDDIRPEDLIKKNLEEKVRIFLDSDAGSEKIEDHSKVSDTLKKLGSFDYINFIRHGVDSSNFNFTISNPLNFDIDFSAEGSFSSSELFSYYSSSRGSSFANSLIFAILVEIILLKDVKEENLQEFLTSKVSSAFSLICRIINRDINKYLPIDSIRLNPAFKVYTDQEKKLVKFQGLILDFKFGGDWLPFSSLSDGTKRLFYLFAEISAVPTYSSLVSTSSPQNRIILVEEPELGVHPHQFHMIMDFLIEISKSNQVIITTHSPQALDVLNANNLETMNICSYSQAEGTRINKLDRNQISKAKRYMEEMYLSDYWVHSNLENRSE